MRIFDRPFLDQRQGRLALYVTGAAGLAKPGLAFETRLQIHNRIGAATVEQIDGAELPPGSSLYVDGDQVVIAWPAYQETGPIPFADGNGGFEKGDTGWEKGAGWTIETTASAGQGFGTHVAAFRAQGVSVLEAAAYAPTFPGQTFDAQVNVQQGASSKYNVGAAIAARFYDVNKTLLSEQIGTFIDDGSRGAWHLSTGSFQAPGGARYVRGMVWGARFRENKVLWVDDASWTLQGVVGINYPTTLPLTLRVRDSAGRSAIWRGNIIVTAVRDYDVEVLADTPVAYWKMDEAAGVTTYADSSGNNIPAACVKTWAAAAFPPSNRAGALRTGGQSANFYDARANIGVLPATNNFAKLGFAPTVRFAVECVIETPTFVGNSGPYVLRKQAATSTANFSDFYLGFSGPGDLRLRFGWTNGGNGSDRSVLSTLALEPGKIYHVVGVADVVDGVVTVYLYINGTLNQMRNDSNMQALPINTANSAFTVNAPQNWAAWSFVGRVSDVALYDHPISAERVANHAQAAGLFAG